MDKVRIGLPTSSQAYKLMSKSKDGKGFGAPALGYIKEKKRELLLGIEMGLNATSHPLSWGSAMEGYVYDVHLDLDYALESKDTDVHESGLFCGTKDLVSENCVGDIKCPFTRSSFCDLVDIINSGSVEFFKKESPEYYWQLVSNSILTKKEYAELIVFTPYESEIPAIVEYIELIDDFELQRDIQWVIHSDVSRIPHLPDNSGYKNIYRFKFLVPKEDKEELLEKIKIAHEIIKL